MLLGRRAIIHPTISVEPGNTLRNLIYGIQCEAGLEVCYDAGAATSFDGSDQRWMDISGNQRHFYRGSSSGEDNWDPSFVGTPGGKSTEYFNLQHVPWGSPPVGDGIDNHNAYFTEGSDFTWADAFHADGAKFTIVAVVYVPPPPAGQGGQEGFQSGWITLFGNTLGTGRGIIFRASNSRDQFALLSFWANDVDGQANLIVTTDKGPDTRGMKLNALNFVCLTYDEDTGTVWMGCNGEYSWGNWDAVGGRYYNGATPGPAEAPYRIARNYIVDGAGYCFDGYRLDCMFMASRAWTTTQLTTLYNSLKANRYPLLATGFNVIAKPGPPVPPGGGGGNPYHDKL